MEITLNGRTADSHQHNAMFCIANALDEIGFRLLASQVRQRYDEPTYKAYISLIKYHVMRHPDLQHVMHNLQGLTE